MLPSQLWPCHSRPGTRQDRAHGKSEGEGAHSVAKTSACVGPAGCTKQLIPDQLLFRFILDHKLGVVPRVTCGLCHTHQPAATVRDGTSLRLLPRDP
jgi:hypothetical protein